MVDTVFFKHKYITMLETSKADAIVVTACNLAKGIQGEMTTNIGETNTQQLTRLVNILQQKIAKEKNKWVEQKSATIPKIHGQPWVDETPQYPTKTQAYSPDINTIVTQNKQPQKIATSPMEPEPPHPHCIMQKDENLALILN